jgi:hypothetical protein
MGAAVKLAVVVLAMVGGVADIRPALNLSSSHSRGNYICLDFGCQLCVFPSVTSTLTGRTKVRCRSRRPKIIRCRHCKGKLEVKAKGPLPLYCRGCRQRAYEKRRYLGPMELLAQDIATLP